MVKSVRCKTVAVGVKISYGRACIWSKSVPLSVWDIVHKFSIQSCLTENMAVLCNIFDTTASHLELQNAYVQHFMFISNSVLTYQVCSYEHGQMSYSFLLFADTQKRERKRRARAAQEARVMAAEKRAEANRAAKIAAMRAFTVDLQVSDYVVVSPLAARTPL